MENKIMMPAFYNVLSCEEMTYTEGGATFTEALLNWIPPIGFSGGKGRGQRGLWSLRTDLMSRVRAGRWQH